MRLLIWRYLLTILGDLYIIGLRMGVEEVFRVSIIAACLAFIF